MNKMPIVDTHLHIWDVNRFHYPWLENESYLKRTFTINEYQEATRNANVEKIVFVQCECEPSQHLKEVKWVSEVAVTNEKRIAGIVAWAPLEKGAAVEEELAEYSKNKLVKGIRRIIQYEEDLEFCLRPDFITGVKLLKKYGMTFDICISDKHNKNVIRFIDKVGEDVPMILDHIGKPDIKEHRLDPWREEIKQMSRFPNVYCKVSSLASEADWERWTLEDIRPFGEHIFECFGFERTAFGSDWPPAQRAKGVDYYKCIELVEQCIKGCSEQDKARLFHDNAIKFYRL
jgi:L-fuconolactonase